MDGHMFDGCLTFAVVCLVLMLLAGIGIGVAVGLIFG